MPTRTALVVGWLILLGGSLVLFGLTTAAAWWQRRREVPGRTRRRADRVEWERHRAAVARRYDQATAQLAAARELAGAAEQELASAWQVLEQAHAAHDTAQRRYAEAAERRVAGAGRPASDPAGQRQVAHAALAAYRRGDLSAEQLWRVWDAGTGADPELAARERALRLARAARREAHLHYRAAADRERAAAAAAEVADVQARALAEEISTALAAAGTQWEDRADERPTRSR